MADLKGLDMHTLEVFDPSGATEVLRLHAPRLDSLEGKRIAFVSNDEWQAHRMLPLVADHLKKEFRNVEIMPYSEFPIGNMNVGNDCINLEFFKLLDGFVIPNIHIAYGKIRVGHDFNVSELFLKIISNERKHAMGLPFIIRDKSNPFSF